MITATPQFFHSNDPCLAARRAGPWESREKLKHSISRRIIIFVNEQAKFWRSSTIYHHASLFSATLLLHRAGTTCSVQRCKSNMAVVLSRTIRPVILGACLHRAAINEPSYAIPAMRRDLAISVALHSVLNHAYRSSMRICISPCLCFRCE